MQYQLLPSLSTDEYAALKADIQERGVMVPIEFDEAGNVLDGHHRLMICKELGIKDYPRMVRVGMTERDKRLHVYKLNLHRRHLTIEQRQDISGRLRQEEDLTYEEIGIMTGVSTMQAQRDVENSDLTNVKTGQRIKGKDGKYYPPKKPRKTKGQKTVFAKNAKEAQSAFDALAVTPADELPDKTIDTKRMARIAREYQAEERANGKTEDYREGNIQFWLGDFRERGNDIPDASVDLIFTDPPYPEKYLPLWYDLSRFAARVLKPEGMLIAYTGAMYLPAVMAGMGDAMNFLWSGSIVLSGPHSRVYARNVM